MRKPAVDPEKAVAAIDQALAFRSDVGGTGGVAEACAIYRQCIEIWAPPGTVFRRLADAVPLYSEKYDRSDMRLQAVLRALREAYVRGEAFTFEEVVNRHVFEDMLGHAHQLLSDEHKLAATVVAGACLERHLRKIAGKHDVTLTKEKGKPRQIADVNTDLKKHDVISQPTWRQIEAWLDLRNEAAHGDPAAATHPRETLQRMIDGIREFIASMPA